jgi:hypothetical protein
VELGVVPSLFPMHTFYWGDWHREHTVGPSAENISPTGWYLTRGARFTSHHDAPVAFPDSMRVLDATVTRRTRSGDILGPHHRVPVDGAEGHDAVVRLPDLRGKRQGLDRARQARRLRDPDGDPTAVDPETIDQIVVAETIKEGVTSMRRRPRS